MDDLANKALLTELLALESRAMDQWGAGDPAGFLELSDDDVSYFDPWQQHRLNSHEELTELYEGLRGQVHLDSFEFRNPAVVAVSDLAVLSFVFTSTSAGTTQSWNATEVFRRNDEGQWHLVHTHWSITEAGQKLDQLASS